MVGIFFCMVNLICSNHTSKPPTKSQILGNPKSGFRWCIKTYLTRNRTPAGTKYEEVFGDTTHWPIWPVTTGSIPVMFRLFHAYWHPNYHEISLEFGYGRSFIGAWVGDTLILNTKRDSTKAGTVEIQAEKKGLFVILQKDQGKMRRVDMKGYEDEGRCDQGGIRVRVAMDGDSAEVIRNGEKSMFYKKVNGKIYWLN